MVDATLQSFRATSDATVEWLLASSREDGSLSEANDEPRSYAKAPLLLLLAGHGRRCQRMLDHLAGRHQRPDGSFVAGVVEEDPSVDGWLVIGSQRAGRFDLARVGWAHLRRYAHPGLGGFCRSGHHSGDGDNIVDLATTAQLGLAALYCGELPLALAAGHCLRLFWERQADRSRLRLQMDDAGDLLETWNARKIRNQVINPEKPDQNWAALGYAIAFLVQLGRATGNASHLSTAHLRTARSFASFVLEGDRFERVLASHTAHGLGWGLALLARVTGESDYREFAWRIAGALRERQEPDGTWLPDADPRSRFEQSIEAALWLREIAQLG